MSAVIHTGLPVPRRACTEHDLDRLIADRLRVFKVSARMSGRRIEHTVIAATSAAAADIAFKTLGWPCACVSPKP